MAQKKKDNITLPEDVLEATEAATLDFTKSSGSYKIDDSVLVKVKSTYFGRLFYRNKKTGESTESNAGCVLQKPVARYPWSCRRLRV